MIGTSHNAGCPHVSEIYYCGVKLQISHTPRLFVVIVLCIISAVHRLYAVHDLVLGKQLMTVLLKLFSYAVNVKVNRQELIKPNLNTVAIMLRALNIVSSSLVDGWIYLDMEPASVYSNK